MPPFFSWKMLYGEVVILDMPSLFSVFFSLPIVRVKLASSCEHLVLTEMLCVINVLQFFISIRHVHFQQRMK